MTGFDVLMIGVGLSMDAFAVSVCKGLAMRRFQLKKALLCGGWFGGFQFLMPVAGFLLGSTVSSYISKIDGPLSFGLLGVIGLNMIRESRHAECDASGASTDARTMLALAVATSIDALAIGVSFAGYRMNVVAASGLIGMTTFCITIAGVLIGVIFGDRFQKKAEFAGGLILILIGLKLLFNL